MFSLFKKKRTPIGIRYQNHLNRKAEIKKRALFKETIFEKLVTNDYYVVEPFQHYHFDVDGRHEIFGILEILGCFGDDVFIKVRKEQNKRKEIIENQRSSSLSI